MINNIIRRSMYIAQKKRKSQWHKSGGSSKLKHDGQWEHKEDQGASRLCEDVDSRKLL